jgi:hypothetical protein
MRHSIAFIVLLLGIILLCAETFHIPQGEYAPRSYVAYQPVDTIIIDGDFSELSWQKATWSQPFMDIEGEDKPAPHYGTQVKILWDKEALYIAAELIEPHIWATLTQRDAVIFHDNDFEVFIDPDGDTHDYYELEINALNTLWDLYLVKPYRDRQQVAINAWDIRDIQSAIGISGTLNNPTDLDSAWRVELKIPLSVLAECAHKPVPPQKSDFWRVNFSRVQWDTAVKDGKYSKTPGVPEHNWVWSPQGLIAMHYPERWGYLFFSDSSVASPEEFYPIPQAEYAKEYLRQLYYKQKQYYMDNGKYATSLKKLKATRLLWQGKKLKPRFETTSKGYIISLPQTRDLPAMFIREDGLLQ